MALVKTLITAVIVTYLYHNNAQLRYVFSPMSNVRIFYDILELFNVDIHNDNHKKWSKCMERKTSPR